MSDTQQKEVRLFDVEEGTILLSKPGATVKVVQAGKLDGKSVSQKAKVKILTSEVQVEIEDPDAILFEWDPEKATDLQGLFKAYEDAATPDRKAELEWVLQYAGVAEESVGQEETAAVVNEEAPVKEAPAKKEKPAPKPETKEPKRGGFKHEGPSRSSIIDRELAAGNQNFEDIAAKAIKELNLQGDVADLTKKIVYQAKARNKWYTVDGKVNPAAAK